VANICIHLKHTKKDSGKTA